MILFTGGEYLTPPRPGTPPQSRPPPGADPPGADLPGSRHPPKQTPPGADTPPGPGTPPDQVPPTPGTPPPGPGTLPWSRYTPHPLEQTPPGAEHAGRYGQHAGGTHPTGMQSCYGFGRKSLVKLQKHGIQPLAHPGLLFGRFPSQTA